MPLLLRATKETTLLLFLKEQLSDWRPATIKQRLQRHCIEVNGEVVTRHGFALHENDEIQIHPAPAGLPRVKEDIEILYLDHALVGIYKPAGLLSVGTERVHDKHALALVRDALGPDQKLWPVHRIDRETSGVLLFARSREVCDALQATWNEVEKVYAVVVEGHPAPPAGVIDQPLYEDKNLRISVRSHPAAKDARTRYRTLKTSRTRSLLEVQLETGRRHQIRAHLAWLGHPVIGDPRYGQKASRMALHALELFFRHPLTHKEIRLQTKVPTVFSKLLSGPTRARKR